MVIGFNRGNGYRVETNIRIRSAFGVPRRGLERPALAEGALRLHHQLSVRWAAVLMVIAGCGNGSVRSIPPTPQSVPPATPGAGPPGGTDAGVSRVTDSGAPMADLAQPGAPPDLASASAPDLAAPDLASPPSADLAPACPQLPVLFAGDFRLGTADESYLYGFSGQTISRIPLGGGAPTVVVGGIETQIDHDLVVDETWLYYVANDPSGDIGNDWVLRAPKTGGSAGLLAGAGILSTLSVAGDYLYFINNGDLEAMVRSGSPQRTTVEPNSVGPFTLDTQSIFIVGPNRSVIIHPLAGGAVTRFGLPDSEIAVDDQYLFRLTTNGPITATSRADGSERPVLDTSGSGVNGWYATLRSDGAFLYAQAGAPMRLYRVARDGSGHTQLAGSAAGRFVLAGDSVYFGVQRGGLLDTWRVCR
jgi:hypothetical protein